MGLHMFAEGLTCVPHFFLTQADNKTTLGGGIAPLPGGGGIFKSAAVAVLRQERKLMSTGEITRQGGGLRSTASSPGR